MNPELEEVIAFVHSVVGGYESYGALYAVGAILAGAIGIYKKQWIQSALRSSPRLERFAWDRWPKWLRKILPFALSGVGTALTAVATGTGAVPAVIAAGITGGVATLQYRATKPSKPTGTRLSVTGLVHDPAMGRGRPPNIGKEPNP